MSGKEILWVLLLLWFRASLGQENGLLALSNGWGSLYTVSQSLPFYVQYYSLWYVWPGCSLIPFQSQSRKKETLLWSKQHPEPQRRIHCKMKESQINVLEYWNLLHKPNFLLFSEDFSNCCSYDEMVTGCRLEKSPSSDTGFECLCGIGCQREFPFETQAECEANVRCK